MSKEMFLLSRVNEPGNGTIGGADYWALAVARHAARAWWRASNRVRRLKRDPVFSMTTGAYGLECFHPSRWLVGGDEALDRAGEAEAVLILPDTPADYGLHEPDCRFDSQTVVISENSLLFQAVYRDTTQRIESAEITANDLRRAASGETNRVPTCES